MYALAGSDRTALASQAKGDRAVRQRSHNTTPKSRESILNVPYGDTPGFRSLSGASPPAEAAVRGGLPLPRIESRPPRIYWLNIVRCNGDIVSCSAGGVAVTSQVAGMRIDCGKGTLATGE